jgi:hypothetical protein
MDAAKAAGLISAGIKDLGEKLNYAPFLSP